LAGPTFGLGQNVMTLMAAIGRGEVTQADVHAFRKMLFFQNLIGARRLYDAAEDGINDYFNVPKSQRTDQQRRLLGD